MMGVRKALDRVFEKNELKILDDILPEFQRHEKLDDEEAFELGVRLATKYIMTAFPLDYNYYWVNLKQLFVTVGWRAG